MFPKQMYAIVEGYVKILRQSVRKTCKVCKQHFIFWGGDTGLQR